SRTSRFHEIPVAIAASTENDDQHRARDLVPAKVAIARKATPAGTILFPHPAKIKKLCVRELLGPQRVSRVSASSLWPGGGGGRANERGVFTWSRVRRAHRRLALAPAPLRRQRCSPRAIRTNQITANFLGFNRTGDFA